MPKVNWEAVATPDMAMIRLLILFAFLLVPAAPVRAASAVNLDSEPQTLIVTEDGGQTDLVLAAGESVQFCQDGCFVTLPNGDREALTGAETIEISGGRARFR